jgi:hypothetical protein
MNPVKKVEITSRILLDKLQEIDGLTRDDLIAGLQHIQSRLKDNSSQEVRNVEHAGFMEAIGDKAPYLLFVLPFIAGPLSRIFKHIPIIGSSLNQMLANLSQSGGSLLMGLLASKFNFSSKAAAPVRQEAPKGAAAMASNH